MSELNGTVVELENNNESQEEIEFVKGQEFTISSKGEEFKAYFSHIAPNGMAYLKDENGKGYERKPEKLLGFDDKTSFSVSTGSNVSKNISKRADNERFKEKMEQFDINQRFNFFENLVDMVIRGNRKSLLCTGPGGLGKTHTVKERLKNPHNQKFLFPEGVDQEFRVKWVGGYSTAKGLYNTLYYYSDALIIFDDCDSIWEDKVAVNILKKALDSYEERIINWNSQAPASSDIPSEFEFTGRIIFVSNKRMEDFNEAVLTRVSKIDMSMTLEEKVDRIEYTLPQLKPDVAMKDKLECLELVKDNMDLVANVNFRTIIEIIEYQQYAKEYGDESDNWKAMAEYAMLTAC